MPLERAARHGARVSCNLQCVERNLHRGVGAVELGHRGLAGERHAAAAQPRGLVRKQSSRLDARCHVGEREVVALFVSTVAHQLSRLVDRRLGDAQGLA